MPSSLNFPGLLATIFLTYLCVYSIISRICHCIEYKAMAKAMAEYVKNTAQAPSKDNLEKMYKEWRDATHYAE